MQETKLKPVIELRGQELSDYIDQLKASGSIKNRRDLRGDVLKAYMADLYERRARFNEANKNKILERKTVEKIDDSAFSNLMNKVMKGIE
jgi:hypothetical protein